ncbi:3'-flap repair endonuclease Xpf [uncultured archaeon]|nr:3'-flap repair endonuclease Xpf [uncultured archaeon]
MEEKERISPQVRIVIDQRESAEYDRLLADGGCTCERQTLSVGDFVLSERLAAERKSRTDFENSLIDGRLFEQAQRLAGTYERAVMIVEGDSHSERINRAALLGAYSALVSDLGISLFFTKNAQKTAELLSALARHEQVAKKTPLRVMAKPKSLSVEQYQRAIIEVLPGVGPQMAKTLLKHFGNPANVLSASEETLVEVRGMGEKRAKLIRRMLDSVWECKEEGE